ncbi:hypothetical protein [Gorillibacterium sp. CAU 1737]|uniref:hypothetical protein n=1 Tax=Gorillibacterium sp. CAU 1737 TaxID=3140362 RepID=UPI0032608260
MNRKRKIWLWAIALVVVLGAIWQWGIPRTQHVTKSFQMVVVNDSIGQVSQREKVYQEGEIVPVQLDLTRKTFLWFRPSISGEFVIGEEGYDIQPVSAEQRNGTTSFSIRRQQADPVSFEFDVVYANSDFTSVAVMTLDGMLAGPAKTLEEARTIYRQVMFPGLKLMD